jgi:hypothetical protein
MKRPMARGIFTVSRTATKLRTFLRKGESAALEKPCRHFKSPIQSHGLQIFIIARQCRNLFIKIDRRPEASFGLINAARNARITGKVENDHGNFGINGLRRSEMASAFSTLSYKRIGETDAQPAVSGSAFTSWLATAAATACRHVES